MRIILNLSHPFKKDSVNHSINKEIFDGKLIKLKYPSVDDLVKIIQKKWETTDEKVLIFKRDLKAAYRQMWMDPGDVHLLGYRIGKFLYFDVTLSMGSKSSAICCQKSTDIITSIFRKYGFENVNYLDDLGGAEVESEADIAFQTLEYILDKMNVQESEQKAVKPAEVVSFLGIKFNTITKTLEIEETKIEEIQKLLREWENRKHATLKQLQQLLGKLNFLCSTVRAGRIFVSRLINAIKKSSEGLNPLSTETKQDVKWWIKFMRYFDGKSMMPDTRWVAPDKELACDASLKGCGGCSHGRYFHATFPQWILRNTNVYINELETIAIMVALKLWSDTFKNRNILVFCDNSTTVDIINTGRAKNEFAQKCLREICWITVQANMVIKVIHRPGVSNTIPDYLSRWDSYTHREMFFKETAGQPVQMCNVNPKLFQFTHKW